MNDAETDRDDALTRSYLNGHIDRASCLRRRPPLGTSRWQAAGDLRMRPPLAAARRRNADQAALTGEPDMLDPARSQIYTGAQVYDNIFSKLIDIDEHQKFYGVLAKSWKQAEPEDVGVRPRAGREVPQRRAVHRGRREVHVRAHPRTRRPRAATRRCTRRSSRSRSTRPTRVTFHLKAPFGPFLTNLANNGEIVNRRRIESRQDSEPATRSAPARSSSSSGCRATTSR